MNVCMMVANPIVFDGRVIRHARALVEAGHRVTVLGVIGPNDSDRELPPDTPFLIKRLRRQKRGFMPRLTWAESALRQRFASAVGRTLSATMLAKLPFWADLAVSTSALELLALALAEPYDVFHSNDLNTLPPVAWAAQLLGRPYVYDAHEFYVEESPSLSEFERRARRLTEGRLAQKAAAVMTVNELLADELAQMYPIARPIVVRNVPPRFAAPDPATLPVGENRTLRLLYHGTHIGLRQPGTDDVLRAMARLRDEVHITLTLRGQQSATEEAQLRDRVQELGLADRIRLAGAVSGPTALMQAAVDEQAEVGLAFHPPLAGNFRLATSSKVYEYQMAGLAVCASDVPGNHVILDESAGVFYPFGDDAKLADLLFSLATNRSRLQALRVAARKRGVTEFAWENERERLVAIYRRLQQTSRD